jgi:hypothetical protein
MSKNDDELNEFIDEVTDGAYSLPCVEVIFKLVKQMQPWGDERIKKIMAALADTFQQYTLVKSVHSNSDTFSCLTGGRIFLYLEPPSGDHISRRKIRHG